LLLLLLATLLRWRLLLLLLLGAALRVGRGWAPLIGLLLRPGNWWREQETVTWLQQRSCTCQKKHRPVLS
jgi:hypothetical protein